MKRIELTFDRQETGPKWIDRERYDATLVVWIEEEGGQFRVLDRSSVTVEVRG